LESLLATFPVVFKVKWHYLNTLYKILVSVLGISVTSEELAEKINHIGITGKSDVTIIIGEDNLPHDELLAISKMEMDLGIKTLIMFEQIYRSYRILNNEPYHK
jgi:23S rRNA (pseudouridine1915-N3)-methyltransferase